MRTRTSRSVVLLGCACALALGGAGARAQEAGKPAEAHALLLGTDGQRVGEAQFVQTPRGVLIHLEAEGLPPGPHALHVHTIGKCQPSFEAAGGHHDPTGKRHGYHAAKGPHAGDLPNIHTDAAGKVEVELLSPDLRLAKGKNALFDDDGAALVIHQNPDDYRTDPAGAAGERIACGPIEPVVPSAKP